MSKNFELMEQSRKVLKVSYAYGSESQTVASSSTGNGHRDGNGLDLDQITQDELLKLVQRVFGKQGREHPRAIVIAGVEPGDGSSRICAGIAKTLAMNVSESVCLVDANVRSNSLPRILDATNFHGLVDSLRDEGAIRDFAQRLRPENLWFLPSGTAVSDSASLSRSDRLKTRLTELRTAFDYLLINAPPVFVDGTATLVGPLVDGAILVVEANLTHREVARKARETLESANVRLLGAVFNNRTFPIPGALYDRL
jgi:capsular exopolysaccharide synthesis family protein